MTTPTRKPLDVKPLNLTQALAAYAAHLAVMTDTELAVERARVEALPSGQVHDVVDREERKRWGNEHGGQS